jgi:tetratricopeptide (TPR) repeat protein
MRILFSFALLSLSLASLPAWAATPADARAWLEAKDERAPAAIEALAKARPRDAEAQVLLVRLRLQQGRADDALDLAEEIVEFAPDDAHAHHWLGNAYGSRIGQVGMLSQAMMAPKLRDAFLRAIELDPDQHEARVSLVEFYLQAPAIAGGSVEAARAQAAELARRDPPRGHYARGRIAAYEKKPADAAAAYTAAFAARPSQAGYRMSAGIAHQEAGQWDQAHALFEAWVAEDAAAAGAWYQLGRIAALSGKYPERGIAALRKYLTLPQAPGQPEAKHAWYRLGQVQARSGDSAAARASWQQALKLDPKFAEAKAELAKLPALN